MTAAPSSKMAVTERAIHEIRQMVVTGEIKPGERLPIESELAARFGMSRNSLREAIRALTAMRVLDVRRGQGTFVTSLEPALLLEAISLVAEMSQQGRTALELVEVRRLLEPGATALAAMRITDNELLALRDHLQAMEDPAPLEAFVAADLLFHRDIVKAADNLVLSGIADGLSSDGMRIRIVRGMSEEGALDRVRSEHRVIYDALVARDPEFARAAAQAHVAGVEAWVRKAFAAATF